MKSATAPLRQAETIMDRIGRLALRSLHEELALQPKPGLVSPSDNGSHSDMDMACFFRSLFSLRHYFRDVAQAGARTPRFAALRDLGMGAEATMLRATDGVNTHRGAIFNLGLLCAAAGLHAEHALPLTAAAVTGSVANRWGADIRASALFAPDSHGLRVARRHRCGGAREQAARGFPDVVHSALPAYRELRASGLEDAERRAAIHALFVLVARLDDSNLLWRGGRFGLDYAQSSAHAFLRAGGGHAPDWEQRARKIHHGFVARRLSPGGSADLLAVTLFLYQLEQLG